MNPEPTNCTDDQLAETLHRSIAFQLLPNLNEPNLTTDTGLVSRDIDHYNLYVKISCGICRHLEILNLSIV